MYNRDMQTQIDKAFTDNADGVIFDLDSQKPDEVIRRAKSYGYNLVKSELAGVPCKGTITKLYFKKS